MFTSMALDQLYIDYGTSRNRSIIPIHNLQSVIGEKVRGLLFVHSLTGCDTTAKMHTIGKTTAIKEYLAGEYSFFPVAEISERDAELFTCKLYSKNSRCSKLNELREELFISNGRSFDRLCCPEDAFITKFLRSLLQALIWSYCTKKCIPVHNPSEYGWILDTNEKWKPIWKQLPKVTDVSINFKVCRCKKHCLKNCGCGILSCTERCGCKKVHCKKPSMYLYYL